MTIEPGRDLVLVCGEGDRSYVHQVFAALEARGITAFYPAHEGSTVELWGENLLEYLQRVIGSGVRYAVVFVSRHLEEALPSYQLRLALSRTIESAGVFLLPVRRDDADLPGLPLGTTGTVDGRRVAPAELARMLDEKLHGSRAGAARPPAPPTDERAEREAGDRFYLIQGDYYENVSSPPRARRRPDDLDDG